jgi:hypothetical protein
MKMGVFTEHGSKKIVNFDGMQWCWGEMQKSNYTKLHKEAQKLCAALCSLCYWILKSIRPSVLRCSCIRAAFKARYSEPGSVRL